MPLIKPHVQSSSLNTVTFEPFYLVSSLLFALGHVSYSFKVVNKIIKLIYNDEEIER